MTESSSTVSALDFGPRAQVDHILPIQLLIWLKHFARRKPLGFMGMVMVLTLIFVAIFAPQLAPFEPNKLDLKHRLAPLDFSSVHKLGSDATGKDILSRLIYGARVSMTVGFGAVAISEAGALLIGVVSGYLGGWFDKIVQRFVEAWMAMPGLLILITFMGVATRMPNVNIILAMLLAIGILGIPGRSRVFRSQVLTLKQAQYVEAAKSLGATDARVIWKCMIPNIMPLVLVSATTGLGGVILAEASLSFLGFGPAGQPSWGQMLSVDGRQYMTQQPGLAIWPGVCIASAVFGFNIFGDALRDVLDPRLRTR